jgi:pimeloyl-ACP methyl ester carboxylesterase
MDGPATSIGAYRLGALDRADRAALQSDLSRRRAWQGELMSPREVPGFVGRLCLEGTEALDAVRADTRPRRTEPGWSTAATPSAGTPLSASDQGDGPVVVLLHGQPGSTLSWVRVLPLLAERGLRVLAVDRPGYGRTGGRALDVFDNAAALRDLLDAHDIARAVLVGHSLGAAVALAMAGCYPRRVQALVLVAPVGGPGGLDALDRVLAAPIVGPAATWLGFRGLGALLSSRRLGTRLVVHRMGIDPAQLVVVLDRLQHGAVWRSFLTEQRALLRCRPGLLHLLPAITTPAAVLAGTRDRLVRPSTAVACHRALAGSSLHWAPGGHLIPAHTPAAVAQLVFEAVRCR